ncbi:hypothetical protein IJJ27_03385 [bacterium]|nr:hypothetical protein [bacterium]
MVKMKKLERVCDRGLVNVAATGCRYLSEERARYYDNRTGSGEYFIFSDEKLVILYNKRDREVEVGLVGAPEGEYVLHYALGRVLQFVPGDWVDHLVDKLLPQVDI